MERKMFGLPGDFFAISCVEVHKRSDKEGPLDGYIVYVARYGVLDGRTRYYMKFKHIQMYINKYNLVEW